MSKYLSTLYDGNGQTTQRGIQAAMLVCLVLTVLSIAAIDRPIADYSHAHWRVNQTFFSAMTKIVDPVPVYAGLVTGGYVIAALFGIRPGPKGMIALRIALAILVAITLKEQIKFLAGRTWPETWTNNNPSYIKDGVYGFFPMKGWGSLGRGYHAFPSGHMTMIAVASVSVALNWPHLRWLMTIPVAIVAIGMVGANYHWVSDLIAGAFLGAAVALAAHRLGTATNPSA